VRVLVLNPGSATLKATVLEPPDRAPRFDRTLTWGGGPVDAGAIRDAVDAAIADAGSGVGAVGYRVVHGGERFTTATLVDDGVVDAIEALGELSPLHNPVAAATIRAGRERLPDVPHVAAFDTAFHATLPEAARRYPVPDDWVAAGVRRFGFHGLSVEWSTRRGAEILARPVGDLRLVVAHLGGGCSVTAVDGGRSVDTSMGMTPLEGLMMGSRAGSIDPGVVLRMIRSGRSAESVEADLDRRSGLVGIAGTADVKELLERETGGDERAGLALELFVHRAAAGMAAAITALPSVDALVFTGGIGEHAASIRDRVVERLHLVAGEAGQSDAADGLRVVRYERGPAVLVVAAREDLVIADAVTSLVG
jgi:acetate kinase